MLYHAAWRVVERTSYVVDNDVIKKKRTYLHVHVDALADEAATAFISSLVEAVMVVLRLYCVSKTQLNDFILLQCSRHYNTVA